MNGRILSILGVRLLLPAISFGSNLLLLRFFGVDRFAVLATLLQGGLLATVLLKFGIDDALLYGRSDLRASGRRDGLAAIAGVVMLVLLPLAFADLAGRSGAGLMVSAAQVLVLGFLNARLAVAAMRLQDVGRVWFGNLAQAIAAPSAAMLGALTLPGIWPMLDRAGDAMLFYVSTGAGFVFWLLLLSLLWRLVSPDGDAGLRDSPGSTTPVPSSNGAASRMSRSLWCLQIIDVLLLSGDLILLGLFNQREGLGPYIAACRLAAASAFVSLAAEQALATLQRGGRSVRMPGWAVPAVMLAMVPGYVLFLHLMGIRAEGHYDLPTLCILMGVAAAQSWFLRGKVEWAARAGVDPLSRHILGVLLAVMAAIALLCWFGLHSGMPAAGRAACFGALALLTRWALYVPMRSAVAATAAAQVPADARCA